MRLYAYIPPDSYPTVPHRNDKIYRVMAVRWLADGDLHTVSIDLGDKQVTVDGQEAEEHNIIIYPLEDMHDHKMILRHGHLSHHELKMRTLQEDPWADYKAKT
jgi:hypothetical protein